MVLAQSFFENFKEKLFALFLYGATLFVLSALLLQLTTITLLFSGHENVVEKMSTEFDHKFNGIYKNMPGNVMYDPSEHIWVESVTNNVKIGKLSGNRQLEFGVKNIIEENLQEIGYDLSPDAVNKLQVQIVYLDVLTTKKNISVFHKNEEEVVIRMKGILFKDGKKIKELMVEESSSEISMSTLIVDEGGKFNQTSLSNAIKKASGKLIEDLTKK